MNMIKYVAGLAVGLGALGVAHGEDARQYSMEFVVAQTRTTHAEVATALASPSNQRVHIVKPELVDTADGEFGPEAIEKQGYTVLSIPRLTVVADSEATIRIGGDEKLEYFEALGDGRYRLKESEEAPFVELGATVSDGQSAGEAVVKFRCSVAVVASRAPVEGTSLPIGKPEIRNLSESFDDPETVPLGKWMMMTVQDDRGANPDTVAPGTMPVKMAVYFRVSAIEAK